MSAPARSTRTRRSSWRRRWGWRGRPGGSPGTAAPWLALLLGGVPCIALILAPPLVQAQPVGVSEPAAALDGLLEARVRQILAAAIASSPPPQPTAGVGGAPAGAPAPRVEIVLGQLDRRLRLAPCQRIEPYLPDGARAWGRSRVGLRCVDGPTRWNVYLPIAVKVFGSGLVATGPLAAGAVLTAADLATGEVDLAEEPAPAIVAGGMAVGRALARPLAAGQSLRVSHLKARQWFAAGATVTIVTQGEGFAVAGEAQALNAGIEGQPVRVRTEGGRVLAGMPVGEHRVEVGL